MKSGGNRMDIEQALNTIKETLDRDGNSGIVMLGNRSDNLVRYDAGGSLEDQAVILLSVMENDHELSNIILWAAEEFCSKRGVELNIPNDILERNG